MAVLEIDTALVLVGGLGTRLRSVVSDVPKPMAPIHGRPFLRYVLSYLSRQGIKRVVLSCGYKSETVLSYFGDRYAGMIISYVIEPHPMGTGGAIAYALSAIDASAFYVLNGDTYFPVELQSLASAFTEKRADLAMACKMVDDRKRYGGVEMKSDGMVLSFLEKGTEKPGPINGGIYVLRRSIFDGIALDVPWSFEHWMTSSVSSNICIVGALFDDPFIDIGIPEDYNRAEALLKS